MYISKSLLILTILFNLSLWGNMGPQGFSEYLNHYFVETGTGNGQSIQKALNTGFQEIRSIEINKAYYSQAVVKFKRLKNVILFQGDSSKNLSLMIRDIDEPITFWLDGHACPPRKDGGKNCPLIEELAQIALHPIKNHTILIDDMHCCATELFDFLTKEDLIRAILKINPEYEITFVPGGDQGEYPENVMVARVPTN